MEVLETFPSPTNGLPVARALRTSVTKEYAVKLFDSCSEVTAFGGMSAIGLICGDMDCTYEGLLNKLGDNYTTAPYHTDYYVGNARTTEITPLKADILTHCWEPTHEGEEACTCEDCSGACGSVRSQYQVADSLRHEKGRCITYGFSEDNVHYNVYNEAPKELTDPHAISLIKDSCPMFQNQAVCCDPVQIETFAKKIKMAATLLATCASCWTNFRTILCQEMCSPDQSNFMEVLETFPSPTNGLPVARALRTSVTKEYAVKLFDSCSEVTAFGGMSAIGLICGDMDCTYEGLLNKLGDNYTTAPYHTDYYVGNARTTEITPLKADVLTHCWEPTHEGEEACTCEDCSRACGSVEIVTAILPLSNGPRHVSAWFFIISAIAHSIF